MKMIKFKNIFNYIVNIPSKLTSRYLSKQIFNEDKNITFYRQPFWLIFLKITAVIILISFVYPYHKKLGILLFKIFDFFKFSEIFNFKMPDEALFIKLSKYLFILVIAYHFLIFLYNQLYALFSSLFVDEKQKTIVYLKSSIIWKKIYFFNINEIQEIIYVENIFSRLIKIGTIKLLRSNGDKVTIKNIFKANKFLSTINNLKNCNVD